MLTFLVTRGSDELGLHTSRNRWAQQMAKKRISSVDLSWLISEEMHDSGSRRSRMVLAVVHDDKQGWRIVVGKRDERFLTSKDKRRLVEVQKRLRLVYELRI